MIWFLLLSQLPILIELIGDWQLIKNGRKDIPWGTRLIMMLIVSVDYTDISWQYVAVVPSRFVACWILYPFFDIFLNKIMGWKWSFMGTTKSWDNTLRRWSPYKLLVVRFMFFGLFIWLWILLK